MCLPSIVIQDKDGFTTPGRKDSTIASNVAPKLRHRFIPSQVDIALPAPTLLESVISRLRDLADVRTANEETLAKAGFCFVAGLMSM